MRITDVTCYPVWADRRNYVFLVVDTDEGLYGLGEAGLSRRERAISGVVEHLKPLLIGQDPSRIEHLWQTMSRGGFFPHDRVVGSAIAAIDIALWDLKAKRYGVPLYDLLGGRVRDRVACYCHLGAPDIDGLVAAAGHRGQDVLEILAGVAEVLLPLQETLDLWRGGGHRAEEAVDGYLVLLHPTAVGLAPGQSHLDLDILEHAPGRQIHQYHLARPQRALLEHLLGWDPDRLPAGIGVEVETRGAVAPVEAEGFEKSGNTYVNGAFGKAEIELRIEVTLGVGEIRLIEIAD